jgi:hypothetical protein
VIALLRRIATRVVMLSIAAVLMALALGLLDGLLVKQHRMGKTNFKPACNGLACQGDSDCGSLCTCEPVPGRALGACVAKVR